MVGLWGMEAHSQIPEASGRREQETRTQDRINHLNFIEADAATEREWENRSEPRVGYNFLIATVTNYHKLRVSQQSRCSPLQLEDRKWGLQGENQGGNNTIFFFLEATWRINFFASSRFLETTHIRDWWTSSLRQSDLPSLHGLQVSVPCFPLVKTFAITLHTWR